MDRETPSFIDPKTIAAIVFCIGFLLLWQGHMNKKYPSKTTNQPPLAQENTEPLKPESKPVPQPLSDSAAKEKFLDFEGENLKFQVSSLGMGLREIVLKNYSDRENKPIAFLSEAPLFAAHLADKEIYFEVEKQDNKFIGIASYKNLQIKRSLTVYDEKYFIESTTEIAGKQDVRISFDEKIVLSKGDVPFLPSYDNSSYYVSYGTKEEREILLEDAIQSTYKNTTLLSIENHYFTRAIIDNSSIKPNLEVLYDIQSTIVRGSFVYEMPDSIKQIKLEHGIYLGPKEKTKLLSIDTRLKAVLNYGFFAWIAHPIMDMIRLFFKWTNNWGLAIIMMTFVVRMLLLPFNMMSHKSMKKMQQIQPKLKALQEKYKDDKLELNKATMEVMRESGANPIGGCLPMLLQFPVFIALFKVLGVSIEFYQAPFFGWIDDLSQRDPYFVLPVLMAASMILHQKISPTTPDPKAKKLMLVMTVVFSLFMVVYPSGLALYIFVGSLFSIIQQLIIVRTEKGG